MDPKSGTSRRGFVAVLGAALPAVAVGATKNGKNDRGRGQGTGSVGLANPVDLYVKPPFDLQAQPWPGLASKMTPQPDHGETSYKGSGRLLDRKALVTGGDSGIGRAVTIAFAREGADVAINYLPAEEPDAKEVVELIRATGRKAVPIPGDLRDETFCKSLVETARRELGGLDLLVNNAGRQHAYENILDIPSEHFDWTFKTNIYAPFWITKAAIPHMPPGSAIINTASINSFDPGETLLDYASTKGAILIFTRALAKQLAHRGIRVNAVAPGPVWTPLQVSGGQLAADLRKFGATTPLGRPGQPAELAPTYVLLASNEASFSTGQVYGVTGGRVMP
jgi:NAD(P)-dependent dehydrogenase (short-subunit alcohol dehydrogenase family)